MSLTLLTDLNEFGTKKERNIIEKLYISFWALLF